MKLLAPLLLIIAAVLLLEAQTDGFKTATFEGPATVAFAITCDGSALSYTTRAVYVGTAGDLVATMATSGTDITFATVPAGTVLPIRITSCDSSSTASDLVGLY